MECACSAMYKKKYNVGCDEATGDLFLICLTSTIDVYELLPDKRDEEKHAKAVEKAQSVGAATEWQKLNQTFKDRTANCDDGSCSL